MHSSKILKAAMVLLPAVGFLLRHPSYLIFDTFTYVGLALLVVTFKVDENIRSKRFFWMVLFCTLFTIILPSTFGAFCIMIFLTLLLTEMLLGKLSLLTVFHLLLLSPLFKYFNSLASFPLRLQVSKVVAFIMNFAGMRVDIAGNLITYDGTTFLVDKACMGLHMLGYSLLFGLVVLSLAEKKGARLNWLNVSALLTILVILNVVSNVIRATVLIIFKILPEYMLHDIVGLLTLGLYVLLPFYFLSRRFKYNTVITDHVVPAYPKGNALLPIACACYVLILVMGNGDLSIPSEPLQFPGFKTSTVIGDVTKLYNEEALIYVKPPVPAYKADHNPLICWQGSGYSFKKIDQQKINGLQVYTAELEKGADKIYTAWWFQYQDHVTSDQWEWRWNAFKKGHRYSMVNVSSSSPELLNRHCMNFLKITSRKKLLN